ncbi:MAG: response regulator [Bacteroidales bacterium]|nr:response regulator [Bacteroidales bacterium]
MSKKLILIVEDEWIIYDELSSFLSQKGFEVSPYTKSFEEAEKQIKNARPDMALLDINLQGDKDGIDIGDLLYSTYKIPFIYLSAYSDEVTLNRAKRNNPDTFLIKTKPEIDKEQLLVSIKMALSRDNNFTSGDREGIFVYSDYYKDLIDTGHKTLKKVLLRFDEILFIETDTGKRNYIVFHSSDAHAYLKSSLTKVTELLPYHYVRINAHQVVNLKKIAGKINHSSFKINHMDFRIGANYSEGVHKVLHSFYHE